MPEGDTIHNTARRLRAALAGHRVVKFELRRDPRGARLPQPGTTIESVEARGKHLLIGFGDGSTLHTHLQMTGAWQLYRDGARWRRPAHRARVVVEIDDGTTAVCFDAPLVEMHGARPTRATRSLDALGPDLCRPESDVADALVRLDRLDPATAIGPALLDQRVAAGVGNVFKSEVCWACRVDPHTPLGALDATTRRALYETAQKMLVANVGTSRRTTYRGGLAVYGRARRPCPRCRTPIRSDRQGDPPRVTYWCPVCQPAVTEA